MRIIRSDGSVQESQLKEASTTLEIKRSDVSKLTPEARLGMIDKMADEMAEKVSKGLFESLNATLEDAGQTVSSRGKPFSIEVFFETLEKMLIDFDKNGQPEGLQLVVHPDMSPTIERLQGEFEIDSELQNRHRELMDRKRGEWRDREASRKLVG
jgi:hypothetical protein